MREEKITDFRGFYHALKEDLEGYRGEFDEIIFLGPELFRLLTNLLDDGRVKKDERLMINAAVAYFVAPHDVIPESIYGPEGYLDDIYLCGHVLTQLRGRLDPKIIEEHWEGEEDIGPLIDEVYGKTKEAIGEEKVDEILVYCGLK